MGDKDKKIQEFKNKVMGYKGKHPEKELYKFFKYYTERKPFYDIPKFSLARRLATWFSPKRSKSFKEKAKNMDNREIQLRILKNSLGKFNPMR